MRKKRPIPNDSYFCNEPAENSEPGKLSNIPEWRILTSNQHRFGINYLKINRNFRRVFESQLSCAPLPELSPHALPAEKIKLRVDVFWRTDFKGWNSEIRKFRIYHPWNE